MDPYLVANFDCPQKENIMPEVIRTNVSESLERFAGTKTVMKPPSYTVDCIREFAVCDLAKALAQVYR